MKRRAFLAALGLAPAMKHVPAAPAVKMTAIGPAEVPLPFGQVISAAAIRAWKHIVCVPMADWLDMEGPAAECRIGPHDVTFAGKVRADGACVLASHYLRAGQCFELHDNRYVLADHNRGTITLGEVDNASVHPLG